ncbi:hypothetical protein GCM10022419_090580 [Nonomuraea rosea]|uniref:Uncharacterized protein n=1 Tax=Nonomuraea rosea TaxID=638574 RepID=A0ABP6YYI0_9ACTN
MPRWPASQGSGGGVNRRRMRGCPSSGQRQVAGEALALGVGMARIRTAKAEAVRVRIGVSRIVMVVTVVVTAFEGAGGGGGIERGVGCADSGLIAAVALVAAAESWW